MNLRYLTNPDDLAFREVLRIYHESFDEASREPDERLIEELRGDYFLPFRFLTAVENDRVVGFARFCQVPESDFGFLIHIAIDEQARGSGLGTHLLKAVIDELAPNPVFVEIERQGRVRDWYERQGFQAVTETYQQPALHDHTTPVPFALCASSPVGDKKQAVLDFYQHIWRRHLPDPMVAEAVEGIVE